MYRSKTVQKFDFGSRADNLKHYGQDTPPLYNLSLVNSPTYLYYSESDWLGMQPTLGSPCWLLFQKSL
uniref:Uncharacterized protein n=1 Tax=Ditylenchus dipsaci TaxID=166011 RepID=A0A915DQH0_9BILA